MVALTSTHTSVRLRAASASAVASGAASDGAAAGGATAVISRDLLTSIGRSKGPEVLWRRERREPPPVVCWNHLLKQACTYGRHCKREHLELDDPALLQASVAWSIGPLFGISAAGRLVRMLTENDAFFDLEADEEKRRAVAKRVKKAFVEKHKLVFGDPSVD